MSQITGPVPTSAPTANRLRDLHPGWFASVMGTAVLAVATYDNPGDTTSLRPVAHLLGIVFAVLAFALAAVLTVAYLVRWTRYRHAAVADLRNPVVGALYGTVPGGLLVLAVMTSVIGPDVLPEAAVTTIVATLTVVGGILAAAISVIFIYVLITGETSHAVVNGGWFIPPVVTIIVPVALAPLIPQVGGANARLLLASGYAFLGLGFLLFLFMMGLLHDRLILHPMPGAPLAPSLWIGLGPIGVGVVGLLSLARVTAPLLPSGGGTVLLLSQFAATGIWGFGVWWLAVAVALLVRYLRSGPLPFGLGWWAFTFPLGAFTVATLALARVWETAALDFFAVGLYAGLMAFWILVSANTVRGLRNGQVWKR